MQVRVLRTQGLAAAIVVALLGMVGCGAPGVGDPCIPEQVPDNGFDDSEAYIESSSVQCETRVCMVWHLKGAPPETQICMRKSDMCAQQAVVTDRVYCTCRCDSGNARFASCTCPSGYTCTPVLEQGSEGVRGSYCVLSKTVSAEM
jgi:hypothetical protein